MRISILQRNKEGTLGETGSEPVLAQTQSLGRLNWALIGEGQQGPIEVRMYQPQHADKVQGINETTGEIVFLASQKVEKASIGFLAGDFPKVKSRVLRELDRAHVSGAQIENVKHSAREHWPISLPPTSEFSLKQIALGGFQSNLGQQYKEQENEWDKLQQERAVKIKKRRQIVDEDVHF